MMHILITILVIIAVAGCSETDNASRPADVLQLQVWAHSGQLAEREVLKQQVSRFNAANQDLQVDLTFIPERDYNAQIQSAAIVGDLPDILEFDGPFLYNYVWQGQLQPLDKLLPLELQADLLASILTQGRYYGRLYAVGTFDSGLGLYGRRSILGRAGIRIPQGVDDAWSAEEFNQALKQLAMIDEDGAVLDLKLNYPGEWFTYAFSPLVQSAGGDLIDRSDYQRATGIINGSAAVHAMQQLQDWFVQDYVDANVDDAAFIGGRVALSWAGHWEYPRYAETFGDDLLILPLPDFGQGSRTGQGSWAWGISADSRHHEAAARFILFLLQTDEVLAISSANGAVPATRRAIDKSPLYRADGPLALFAAQLQGGYAIPRPQTPAYPVITSAFQQAFRDIRNGMKVQQALDKAADMIDRDILDNHGYPFQVP